MRSAYVDYVLPVSLLRKAVFRTPACRTANSTLRMCAGSILDLSGLTKVVPNGLRTFHVGQQDRDGRVWTCTPLALRLWNTARLTKFYHILRRLPLHMDFFRRAHRSNTNACRNGLFLIVQYELLTKPYTVSYSPRPSHDGVVKTTTVWFWVGSCDFEYA